MRKVVLSAAATGALGEVSSRAGGPEHGAVGFRGARRSGVDGGAEVDVAQEYYGLLEALDRVARSGGDDRERIELCKRSLPLLPDFVASTKRRFGKFDIKSIPALEVGCELLPAVGDVEALRLASQMVEACPELEPWKSRVDQALADAALAERILDHLRQKPGTMQTRVHTVVDATQERTRSICYWMTRLGRIRREKSGRSYALFAV